MANGTNEAAVTLDAVKSLIVESLKPVIDAQKIIADTMAADAQAKAADAKKAADADAAAKAAAAAKGDDGKPKPLTAEDVTKLVADSLGATLKARDEAAKSTAARDAFLADKLKDVPAAYRAQLGNDPAKWGAEEQAIRATLKSDLAGMGAKVPDVKGSQGGGGTASGGAGNATPNPAAANLTPGQAAFASGLVIPGAATAAA